MTGAGSTSSFGTARHFLLISAVTLVSPLGTQTSQGRPIHGKWRGGSSRGLALPSRCEVRGPVDVRQRKGW